jgi:hypothetical protein
MILERIDEKYMGNPYIRRRIAVSVGAIGSVNSIGSRKGRSFKPHFVSSSVKLALMVFLESSPHGNKSQET